MECDVIFQLLYTFLLIYILYHNLYILLIHLPILF